MLNLEKLLDDLGDQVISDIHFISGVPPRIRVHGELMDMPGYEALDPDSCKRTIYSFLSPEQIRKFESSGDIDLAFSCSGHRFRTNVYHHMGNIAAALRWLPDKIGTFTELGLPEEVCEDLCAKPNGLVIVAGVAGSGKSTTLASMIEHINKTRQSHVVTVEDPVEFLHYHGTSTFSQREVGLDTESYEAALRSAMRQDPDVVLVGEMRDTETVQAALNLADTGHLTFSTLHTSDAVQTVNRIIDIFPEHRQEQARVQLSFVLQAVICQQLLPNVTKTGRVLITEILIVTPAVRTLIRESKIHQIFSTIQSGGRLQMHTMNHALEQAVKAKLITREVAYAHSSNPDALKLVF